MIQLMVGIGFLVVLVLVGVFLVWLAFVFARRSAPELTGLGNPSEGDQLTRYQLLCLQGERLKARNDSRNGLLQTTAGLAVIAALLAGWFQVQSSQVQFAQQQASSQAQFAQQLASSQGQFAQQQDLTRRGQLADRFRAAIEQIGRSDSADAVLGGIYVLESVARDAWESVPQQNRIRLAVYDVLVAYIDRHAAWTIGQPKPNSRELDTMRISAPDLQAALTVLGRRDHLQSDPFLDLGYVAITDADLSNADFSGAWFIGDDLENVDFVGAHLENAKFGAAEFNRTLLYHAHLEHANLNHADLSQAIDLKDAYLQGAVADAKTKWPTGFDWQAAGVTQG
jgi:uncharacterized protein YjbI with pentapeptide repeats